MLLLLVRAGISAVTRSPREDDLRKYKDEQQEEEEYAYQRVNDESPPSWTQDIRGKSSLPAGLNW